MRQPTRLMEVAQVTQKHLQVRRTRSLWKTAVSSWSPSPALPNPSAGVVGKGTSKRCRFRLFCLAVMHLLRPTAGSCISCKHGHNRQAVLTCSSLNSDLAQAACLSTPACRIASWGHGRPKARTLASILSVSRACNHEQRSIAFGALKHWHCHHAARIIESRSYTGGCTFRTQTESCASYNPARRT